MEPNSKTKYIFFQVINASNSQKDIKFSSLLHLAINRFINILTRKPISIIGYNLHHLTLSLAKKVVDTYQIRVNRFLALLFVRLLQRRLLECMRNVQSGSIKSSILVVAIILRWGCFSVTAATVVAAVAVGRHLSCMACQLDFGTKRNKTIVKLRLQCKNQNVQRP